jgi:multicomponent Na+:H+ antiporter subunit C
VAQWQLYALGGVALFATGLVGMFAVRHVIQRVLAGNILGSGVFLVLIAIGSRGPDATDPVPQALVLTGLVVAVSATALALCLARQGGAPRGAARLDGDDS